MGAWRDQPNLTARVHTDDLPFSDQARENGRPAAKLSDVEIAAPATVMSLGPPKLVCWLRESPSAEKIRMWRKRFFRCSMMKASRCC